MEQQAAGGSSEHRRWQRETCWLSAVFDDSLVMLHLETGQYLGLNETARAIWDVLDEPMTMSAIVEHLRQTFDVAPDQCAAAVDRTLRLLEEKGAVQAA